MYFKTLFLTLLLTLFTACSEETSPTTEEPSFTQEPVHVSLVLHYEEDFTQKAEYFLLKRNELIEFANFLSQNNLKLNIQPDWAFMQAIEDFETDKMRASTNEKNILRYLVEDLHHEVDPHAHEHGYNYADVAYMISALGITPSNIVGGFIVDPVEDSKYENFLGPIIANHFDYTWQAEWLWGGGTSGHTNDTHSSGVWKPKAIDAFFVNDEDAPIACIGKYTNDIDGVYELINLAQAGEVEEGKMLTATIFIGQGTISEMTKEIKSQLPSLQSYEAEGKLKFSSLSEVTQIWSNEYQAKGYIYIKPSTD